MNKLLAEKQAVALPIRYEEVKDERIITGLCSEKAPEWVICFEEKFQQRTALQKIR